MKLLFFGITALALTAPVSAKLPAPNDAAKAQATEAAAKAAHAGKIEAYQLCKRQDKVGARTKDAASKSTVKDKQGSPLQLVSTPVRLFMCPQQRLQRR